MNDAQILNVITSVYVIATIFIMISNSKTAKASKEQTEEMKRQYNDQNKPDVDVYFDIVGRGSCGFIIKNNGNRPATDLSITINDEFSNNMIDHHKTQIKNINKSKLYLSPNKERIIYLGGIGTNFQNLCRNKAIIKVKYNSFEKEFEFDLNNYSWMVVGEDLSAKTVKTLENIDKKIENLNKTIKLAYHTPKINTGIEKDTLIFKIYAYICENPGCETKEIINKFKNSEKEVFECLKTLAYTYSIITYSSSLNTNGIENPNNNWYKK